MEETKIIGDVVRTVEQIGEYIIEHIEDEIEKIAITIAEDFGYLLSKDEIEAVINDKSEGKYALAWKLITKCFRERGLGIVKQVINLGIEYAVSLFFGKK